MSERNSTLHPAIAELARLMPPAGTPWPLDQRVAYLIAFDAVLALIHGGATHMIWIGADGEIHIAPRTAPAERTNDA